jgi:Flp pilus assembly protein TadB
MTYTTNNVRTTTTDRLDYLRLFLGCLEANVAMGHDINHVITDLRRAIRKREKEAEQ